MNLHCSKPYLRIFSLKALGVLAIVLPSIALPQTVASSEASALTNTSEEMAHSSLGLRVGSTGWGAEYKARIQPHLDLRVVWQTLAPGRFEVNTESLTETTYQTQGSFRSSGIITDWYPWTTPIRFSFGLFRNTSQFRLTQQSPSSGPTNTYNANFGQLSYFFGTGWAPRINSHRLTLTLDVGLLAQQPPYLTWNTDSAVRNAAETDRIWSEKKLLKQELEEYKILPFVMIGLSYKIY